MVERRLTGMIAAAAVLIVLFIFWDAFRPAPRAIDVSEPLPATLAVDSVAHQTAPPAPPPAPQPIAPATTSSAGAAGPAVTGGRQPSYFDLLARSETRRRIRPSGPGTHLGDMRAASDDSMLRRWDNRVQSPVRVWLASTHEANFRPLFLDQICSALDEWLSPGLPVRFDFAMDSTQADIIEK